MIIGQYGLHDTNLRISADRKLIRIMVMFYFVTIVTSNKRCEQKPLIIGNVGENTFAFEGDMFCTLFKFTRRIRMTISRGYYELETRLTMIKTRDFAYDHVCNINEDVWNGNDATPLSQSDSLNGA